MEEYVEWENETVQATQAIVEQDEERGEVNRVFELMRKNQEKISGELKKLKQSRDLKK